MSYDDENTLSTSSGAYLESPDKARLKELQKKMEKQGLKAEANKPGADLKSLKLTMLKNQVASDEKNKKDENQKAPVTFGTKTREQEIAAQKLDGNTKQTTDQILAQDKQEAAAKAEEKKNEVTGEGG